MWTLIFIINILVTPYQYIQVDDIRSEELCDLNAQKLDTELKKIDPSLTNFHVCVMETT